MKSVDVQPLDVVPRDQSITTDQHAGTGRHDDLAVLAVDGHRPAAQRREEVRRVGLVPFELHRRTVATSADTCDTCYGNHGWAGLNGVWQPCPKCGAA